MNINKCEFVSFMPGEYNSRIITLSHEDKRISICIGNSIHKIKQGLSNILDNKAERCYFAFGMSDIDVFRIEDMVIIEVSPVDGIYNYYGLDVENFKKLIANVK